MIEGVQAAAWRLNRWMVWAIVVTEPRDGHVRHGTVVVERQAAPSGRPGTEWATTEWAEHEGVGVVFFSGHYDLTRDEAMADFGRRSDLNMDLRAAYPALALIQERRASSAEGDDDVQN